MSFQSLISEKPLNREWINRAPLLCAVRKATGAGPWSVRGQYHRPFEWL